MCTIVILCLTLALATPFFVAARTFVAAWLTAAWPRGFRGVAGVAVARRSRLAAFPRRTLTTAATFTPALTATFAATTAAVTTAAFAATTALG